MKKISQRILVVCVAVTLLFIWVNSMLPGDISSMESGWVQRLLGPALDYIYGGRLQADLERLALRLPAWLGGAVGHLAAWLGERLPYIWPSVLVRKTAHVAEYATLGFFMGLLFVRRDGRSRFFLPALACLAAAAVDEAIQLLVAGRAGQLRDVCIDMSGALTGLALALLLLAVIRLFYRKKPPEFGKNS